MKEIRGYLDITPGDFKEIYGFAFRHAYKRLTQTIRGKDIMTSPAVTVSVTSPLSEIASLLSEKNIRRVPVTTPDGVLKGIISRVDLIQSFCSLDA